MSAFASSLNTTETKRRKAKRRRVMVVIVVVVVFFTPKPHIIEKERTHICSTSPSLSTFCMHFHTVGSVVDASTGDPLGRKNGDSSTFSKNSRSSVYRIASGSFALSSSSSSSSSVSSFNVALVMLLLLLLLLLLDDDDDDEKCERKEIQRIGIRGGFLKARGFFAQSVTQQHEGYREYTIFRTLAFDGGK